MSQIVDIAANCDMSHIRYSMEKIALKLARCTISFVRKDSYIQEYFFFSIYRYGTKPEYSTDDFGKGQIDRYWCGAYSCHIREKNLGIVKVLWDNLFVAMSTMILQISKTNSMICYFLNWIIQL